jgi:hypothetical protein
VVVHFLVSIIASYTKVCIIDNPSSGKWSLYAESSLLGNKQNFTHILGATSIAMYLFLIPTAQPGIVILLGAGRQRNSSSTHWRGKTFVFAVYAPARRLGHPPILWGHRGSSAGKKTPVRKTDHSPPRRVEVKNTMSYSPH